MEEAFQRHAGLPLAPYLRDDPSFARAAVERKQYGLSPKDTPSTMY